MIEFSKITIVFIPLLIPNNYEVKVKNEYAKSIPYESIYIINKNPNESTLNYHIQIFDEIIKKQQERTLEKAFSK